MKFFTILDGENIHLAAEKKVVPAVEFSALLSAQELLETVKKKEELYRIEVVKECETLKEISQSVGFEEGLQAWTDQIALLEEEIKKVRHETEKTLVSLAVTAVKKIIGRELEVKPETISDIVATSLKSVVHHRKVTIYVNQQDLDEVESQKGRFKVLFERLESLSIIARADIPRGSCVIETEAGIINARLENQLQALESAFKAFFSKPADKEVQ